MSPISYSGHSGLHLAFLTLISAVSASPVPGSPASASPTPVSVTPYFVQNAPGNTHTSTIGPNGYATPVPVVGGPECWFCPGEHEYEAGAWALLGITEPGTYQPSSVSEDFDQPFPVVNVSSNGDPIYGPSRTTTDISATKAKRDPPIPTKTEDTMSPNFKLLRDHMPSIRKVKNNERYAMTAKQYYDYMGVKVTFHQLLSVAQVTVDYGYQKATRCGKTESVTVHRYFDWKPGKTWHLGFNDNNEIFSKKISTPAVDLRLPDLDPPLAGISWRFLGPVRDDMDDAAVQRVSDGLVADMNARGGYNFFFNNCRDYAYYLYKRIRK